MSSSIEIGCSYSDAMQRFWHAEDSPRHDVPEPKELTGGWVTNESRIPYLQLLLDVPYLDCQREVLPLLDRFVEHRGGDGHGWKSLTLHGLGSTQTRSPRHYGYTEEDAPYEWTEIASLCPVTAQFFRDHFAMGRLLRVRFMLLEPGGYVGPHRDTSTHYLSAMNVAITNPAGAHFKMKGVGCVPFQDGRAFLLDVGHEHSVINLSKEPRIHVIVHGDHPSDAWNDLVVRSYRSTYAPHRSTR